MADQSDVEGALVDIIAAALYPQGGAAPSMIGRAIRIYRGWPQESALADDLGAGVAHVSVVAAQVLRNTTRYLDLDLPLPSANPTMTVTVAGDTATFTGIPSVGQVAGLWADTIAVVHRVTSGDTLAMVAAVLATRMATQRIALVAGTSVTVPGVGLLTGRVVVDQKNLSEIRRQLQRFRISVWCDDPAARDVVATAVDLGVSVTSFLPLTDGTLGRLRFSGSRVSDASGPAGLWCREIDVEVDYPTTIAQVQPSVIFGDTTLTTNGASGPTQIY